MGVKPDLIDPKTVVCPTCLVGVRTPCWTSAYGGTHRARRIKAERVAHEKAVFERSRRTTDRSVWA